MDIVRQISKSIRPKLTRLLLKICIPSVVSFRADVPWEYFVSVSPYQPSQFIIYYSRSAANQLHALRNPSLKSFIFEQVPLTVLPHVLVFQTFFFSLLHLHSKHKFYSEF